MKIQLHTQRARQKMYCPSPIPDSHTLHQTRSYLLELAILIIVYFITLGRCEALPSYTITSHKSIYPAGVMLTYKVLWPYEDDNSIVCQSSTKDCKLEICFLKPHSSPWCNLASQDATAKIRPGATMKEAKDAWVEKFGMISQDLSLHFGAAGEKTGCITMTIGEGYPYSSTGRSTSTLCDGEFPAIDTSCTATETLNINYNNLEDNKVNDAKAYGVINVTCSALATVKLSLIGPRKIDLGRNGTLKATILINGKDAADTYVFTNNGNNIGLQVTSVLESTLKTPAPGYFQGNGVIMLSYM